MRRLLAGLVGIAVVAGALAWFAQGVAVGQDPGPYVESSFQDEIAGRVSPVELQLAPHALQPLATLPKYEDFEGPWPNDWQLLATQLKWWGPNECLAFEGAYDGWPASFPRPPQGEGYCSHTNPPTCTIPSGYPLSFESYMIHGPFSTVGATSGGVDFKALIDTELDYDWAGVIAKTGGNCADFPGTYNGPIRSGDWGGWFDWSEDLADFPGVGNLLGYPDVCIAFVFLSDSISNNYPGFFLDNINIWSETEVTPEPTPEVDYWAVIAGVADYPGTANDLDYTDDDAYDVRDALLASTNWEASHITMLIDGDATKANIQDAINWMGTSGDANDAFFLFFSGHGTTVSDQAPLDETDGYDEALVQYDFATAGFILDDELGDWFTALPGSPELVAIDACFSGGMIRTDEGQSRGLSGAGIPAPGDSFARDLDDVVDGVVLTAADDDELSWGVGALQNGLFTYYFVEGLYGPADTEGNGDNTASMEEAFDYLYPRVLAYPVPEPQHPQQYDNWPGEAPLTIIIPVPPATVRIGSGRAPTCTEGSVSLEILGPPRPVGAVTVDIVYNPAVVEPTKAVGGDAYNSVVCNLTYAPNTVRCAGVSTAGVPGDSLLADITFHCIGETGECSPLDVQIVTFADPDGIPILPVTAEDGEFCCGGCGDVDCDDDVDAVDALFILQYVVNLRDGSDECPPPPDTLYLPAANVDCDDDVDAVDALFILQHVVDLRPDLCVCTEP